MQTRDSGADDSDFRHERTMPDGCAAGAETRPGNFSRVSWDSSERNLEREQAAALRPARDDPAELDRVQLDGRTAGAVCPVPAGRPTEHQPARLTVPPRPFGH